MGEVQVELESQARIRASLAKQIVMSTIGRASSLQGTLSGSAAALGYRRSAGTCCATRLGRTPRCLA
jgi:hypothetical protein